MSSTWNSIAALARKAQLDTFGITATFTSEQTGQAQSVKVAWLEGLPDGQPRRYGVLLANTGDGAGLLPPSLFQVQDLVDIDGKRYLIIEIDIRKFGLSRVVVEAKD